MKKFIKGFLIKTIKKLLKNILVTRCKKYWKKKVSVKHSTVPDCFSI